MTGRLSGKVALVIGAGASAPGWSNGRATAVLFAREGARVLAADVDEAAATETARIATDKGGDCTPLVADATRLPDLVAAVDVALARWGRLDIVHNNVGRGAGGGPAEMDEAAWHAGLTLNLTSAFLAIKAALPPMLTQGGGVFVHVGSIVGLRYPGTSAIAYQVAKSGLLQLSRATALEYARRGIRSNCILPGYVDTPEIRRRVVARWGERADEVMQRRAEVVPQGRAGTAWDIAHAALFLASDEAAHVTGTELIVDGGSSALTLGAYAPS